MLRFLSACLLAAFGAVALGAGPAAAQSLDPTWPNRPIRFVVPFPAGAVTDVVSRIVASKLQERLGQPVVIENRAGASGGVGAIEVMRSAPDGYTIGLATASTHAISSALNPSLNYDPVKDFAHIAMIGDAPYVLVVNTKVPAQNVAELVALAKAKPGALNYSTVGPASLASFAGALFSNVAGVKLTQVPYRSATHAVVDLNEGRIEMQFGAIAASLPHVRDGKLRALAVTSLARVEALPDVPAFAEAGFPGYEAVLWMGIIMPPGTPAALVERMNKEVRAAVADPEVQKGLAGQVMVPRSSSPDEMRERISQDIAKWRRIAAEAGIKAE